MRVGYVIPPTQLIWHTIDIPTTYNISREISIEHPSVGLASLAQLGQRKIDIDVAGKASYKLSNLTSLPSFL